MGITLTYDGTALASGISANALGGWSASVVVPPSASGSHTIGAYGSVTLAAAVRNIIFTVTPSIALSRTSGSPGTSIAMTGAGFAASETGITITYDGTNVATGIRANAQGSFTATFAAPNSASGSHTIAVYGTTTQAVSVTFTVVAAISISQTSGSPGSTIVVTGIGFGANETGITVSYDGAPVASGIRANAQGSWTATFVIPASAAGSHTIAAFGSTTSSVPGVIFTIIKVPLTASFGGWYVGGIQVTTATKNSTVTARLTISGGDPGQYKIRIRRAITLWPDSVEAELTFDYNGISAIKELTFTAHYATGEASTEGYHMDLTKDGYAVWTMANAYPPRLKVTK